MQMIIFKTQNGIFRRVYVASRDVKFEVAAGHSRNICIDNIKAQENIKYSLKVLVGKSS